MVLSLFPDRRRESERDAGREGTGSQRGSCTRKRGVLPKNKFWGWMGLEEVNVWVLRGMGFSPIGLNQVKSHQNLANPIR